MDKKDLMGENLNLMEEHSVIENKTISDKIINNPLEMLAKPLDLFKRRKGLDSNILNEKATDYFISIFDKYIVGTKVSNISCYTDAIEKNDINSTNVNFEGNFANFRVNGMPLAGKIKATLNVKFGLQGPYINNESKTIINLIVKDDMDNDMMVSRIKQEIKKMDGVIFIDVKNNNAAFSGDEVETFVTYTENRDKIIYAKFIFRQINEGPLQLNNFPEFKIIKTMWIPGGFNPIYSCVFPSEKRIIKDIKQKQYNYYYSLFKENNKDNIIIIQNLSKTVVIPQYKDGNVEAVAGRIKLKIKCKYQLSFLGFFYRNEIYTDDWYVEYKYEEDSQKLVFMDAYIK
jgi:hypothetical protein